MKKCDWDHKQKIKKIGEKMTFFIFFWGGGCKTTYCINGKGKKSQFLIINAIMVSEIIFSKRGCKKRCKNTIQKWDFRGLKNKNCDFRGSFDNFKNNIKIKYNNIIILKYKTHIKDDL